MVKLLRETAYWQETGIDPALELGHTDTAQEGISRALFLLDSLDAPPEITHFLEMKRAAIPLYEHAHASRVVANTPLNNSIVERTLKTSLELMAKTQKEISQMSHSRSRGLAGAQGEHAAMLLPLVAIAERGFYFLPASASENRSPEDQIDLRTVDLSRAHSFDRVPIQVKLDLDAPHVEFSHRPDIRHVGLMQINPEAVHTRGKTKVPSYSINHQNALPNLLIAYGQGNLGKRTNILGDVGIRLHAIIRPTEL